VRVEDKTALGNLFSAFILSGVTKLKFLKWAGGPNGGAVRWERTANWGVRKALRQLGVLDR